MSEKKAVTIVTQATKGLSSQIATLTKLIVTLESLGVTSAEMTDEIVLKQATLDEIADNTKEGLRRAKAELDTKVLENELAVIKNLLKKNSLAEITATDLATLRAELVSALEIKEDMVSDAVASAEAVIEAEYKLERVTTDAENSILVAELKANHKSKDEVIRAQNVEIQSLKDMLTAQRDAQVKMAEASSNQAGPSFTVGK